MDISLIIKVGGIGILISTVTIYLEQQGKKEMAGYTTLAGVLLVLTIILSEMYNLFNTVRTMFQLY